MSRKTLIVMISLIALLSAISSLTGILSNSEGDIASYISVYGDPVELYNKGIYKMNSVSVAAQGIASDWITILLGIPVLLLSLRAYVRNSLKGQLVLIGILSYFIYTYTSYVFLWFYNPLFLIYVANMSLSLFATVGLICSMDFMAFGKSIDTSKKTKGYAMVQIIVSLGMGLMWLGVIIPTIQPARAPAILEHYTTLVIQGMDLGIVVPLAFYAGIQLMRKEMVGYFLTPIILTKGIAMLLAIFAMMVNMVLNDVNVGWFQLNIIPVFCISFAAAMYSYLNNVVRAVP